MFSSHAPFGIRFNLTSRQGAKALFMTLLLSVVIGCSYFLQQGHDDQRLLQLAFFGVVCLSLFSSRLHPLVAMSPGRRKVLWCAAGFFLLGIVSGAVALSPRHALLEVAIFLMLFLTALCVAQEIAQDSARNIVWVLNACAIGSLLYAIKIAVIYLTALALGAQPSVDDFTPGFSNIRFLNHAQTISLPLLALLCLLNTSGRKAKWGYLALTALCWTLLFITAGRGAFVALLAGTAGALVLRGKHAGAFCTTMLATALAGIAMYAVFFTLIPMAAGLEPFGMMGDIAQRTAENPTSLRVPLWTRAGELIAAHPWLGVGPLHYAHFAIDDDLPAHPHNWLLQIAAEWGLPALCCLLAAIGLALRHLVLSASHIAADDHCKQNTLVAWIATALAILVDGLVSGSIVMPVSQLWIALYIGCASGWVMSLNPPGQRRQPGLRRDVVAVLSLLAMAALAIGIGTDMGSRGSLRSGAPAENHGTNHPRIWLDGYF